MSTSIQQPIDKIKELSTPCLLVDLDKVERNVRRMKTMCERLGLKLRPHMKTSKCLEAGLLMTDHTRCHIVVSTLREAEFFADGGFDDVLYAMLFTEDKIPRLQMLTERLKAFHVVIETEEAVRMLEAHPPGGGRQWSVYLFVDTGDRRGVQWDGNEALDIARMLDRSQSLAFQGLYAHEGHSYAARGQQQITDIADQTAERLVSLSNRLREKGIKCKELTFGATPTGSHPGEKVRQLTEIHPGNYVFYDLMQHVIGSCSVDDIAVRVMTRVIGRYPQRQQIVIDAGWTALSKDGPMEDESYAVFEGHPGLKLRGMNQEVGIVDVDTVIQSFDDLPVGKLLLLYPYHACATCAMHRQYYVHRGDDVIDVWHPCSGW